MDQDRENRETLVNFWFSSAKKDRKTAKDLFLLKHYDWSLFIWQLVLEKTLKAIISYKGEEVPFLHDLNRLAKKAGLELPKDFIEDFDEITTFNLQARYDDYRYNFYKKATPSFSEKWGKKCDFYYKWLIKRK